MLSGHRSLGALAALAALALSVGASQAGVSLNAARVGGPDVAALARFYETAFGLKEVNRLQTPGGTEVMLNFGDSEAAAKANGAAQIVLMHRAQALKDPVPHMILNVTDMSATVKAVQDAGGHVLGKPRAFGQTGIIVGMVMDPAGNRIELLQRPAGGT